MLTATTALLLVGCQNTENTDQKTTEKTEQTENTTEIVEYTKDYEQAKEEQIQAFKDYLLERSEYQDGTYQSNLNLYISEKALDKYELESTSRIAEKDDDQYKFPKIKSELKFQDDKYEVKVESPLQDLFIAKDHGIGVDGIYYNNLSLIVDTVEHLLDNDEKIVNYRQKTFQPNFEEKAKSFIEKYDGKWIAADGSGQNNGEHLRTKVKNKYSILHAALEELDQTEFKQKDNKVYVEYTKENVNYLIEDFAKAEVNFPIFTIPETFNLILEFDPTEGTLNVIRPNENGDRHLIYTTQFTQDVEIVAPTENIWDEAEQFSNDYSNLIEPSDELKAEQKAYEKQIQDALDQKEENTETPNVEEPPADEVD